jgi:hypothetical protein
MKKGIQAKIKEEQLPDEPQVNQLASKIIFYYLSGLGLGICKLFPPLLTPGFIMLMFSNIYYEFIKVPLVFWVQIMHVSKYDVMVPVVCLYNLSETRSIIIYK